MKTKFPKSFVLLIAAMIIIVALFVTASAKNNELSPQSVSDVSSEYDVPSEDELPMSGYCGENIKWELDENGVLRLEGSGDMYDFNENNYCYGYYPADPSSSTTRSETTTVPYSYYPTTRPYAENTTYYPATTTAPYSQEYTTNPYSDETTYYYGTTTAPATTARQETTTYPQYSTTTYYQEPTSGYSESTTVYYGTTTAPTTTARQETTTYPQYSATTTYFYQEPTSSYSESTTVYYGTTTEPRTTAPTTIQPATTYYPTTTSPYYPDWSVTEPYSRNDNWVYEKIYRWNLHFDEIQEVIIGEGITSVGYSAFANCTNLKSVTLPSTLTSIGSHAFANCTNLKSVTLPNTLTSIDSYAFKMCISLEEISVPDSVETIGNEAFYGCLNLKKITLGNGIKSIDYGAFEETGYYINEENWTDNVLYIDNYLIKADDDISGECAIKDGTTDIVNYAFYECDSLTNVIIPNSITNIGDYAFLGCLSLENISISNNTTRIGNYAFYSCYRLSNIKIPNSVTSIGYRAFENCYGLTSVTIPDSVTSIGYFAFSGCTRLTSVTIPDSLTSIGDSAFIGCTGLTSITVDVNNPNYSSDKYGVLFNKDKTELIQYPVGNKRTEYIIPDSVTSIGDRAFYDCTGLTSVTIPDSVTNIDNSAFYNCTGLTSVTIPDSVTIIGNSAFYYCTRLTSITIPDSVTSIGGYAFYYCNGLTSVSIGNSVTIIGNRAFSFCTGLTSVTIPDSVTNIGSGAFRDCTKLTSVSIGNSVTSIGWGAFRDCTGLTSITVDENNPNFSSDESGVWFNKDKTELIQYPIGNGKTEYIIPDSVTSIGDDAFSYCTGLTSVTIPDSVTIIGDNAFYNCTRLTSVSIPDSVTNIGYQAFSCCTGLTSITVDENNPNYSSDESGVLYNKYKTELIQYPIGSERTEYIIPDSVTIIGDNALYNCTGLTSITVDENNTNYSSDEYGVLFNKDKTKIIQYPIGNERTEYIIPDSVTSIGNRAFSSCGSLSNVSIPKSICSVNWYAFSDCYNLNTVYYSGSPSMWDSIYFEYGNDDLINATIIFAEENPPEPATIVDEGTNVSVDYDAGKVEGEVGLSVEQTFDGKAFDIISTELEINDNVIYDIKMTVDGVETQPSGTVTVRIPLPEGYDPTKTFVYHVNTQIGTLERMNAVYEDGYLVFETDHFSYYAVVEIKDDEPVEVRFKVTWNSNGVVAENEYKEGERITVPQNPTKEGYVFVGWSPSVPEFMPAYDLTFTAVFEAVVPPTDPHFEAGIVKPSTSSVDYGDSIILHAQIDGALPEGAYIVWSESNGNFDMSVSDDGLTCKVSPKANGKTTFTITVYDKDGNVISSGTQVMNANAGLWQRIVAFFKKIFGLTKTIPQVFKGIF